MEMTRRSFALVLAFACCFLVFLISYSDTRFGSLGFPWFRSPETNLKSQGYLIDTKGCHMPNWDPFDPGVKSLYAALRVPYDCGRKPSFLTVQPNATVQLNHIILNRHYRLNPSIVRCTYQEILRDQGKVDHPTDDNFILTPPRDLTFGVPLSIDSLHAKCFVSGRQIHDEYLALTPLKEAVEERCREATETNRNNGSSPPDRLNVVVVGIDSISKLNFIRHFGRTRNFLRQKLRAFELRGYNKVADNTFPNLVPLLTGHFISHYWNESLKDMFFDDIDLVWRHFATLGYRTLLAEDAPDMAIFNYLKRGFRTPPVDYYLRPFARSVEESAMRKRSKPHCFDDRMEMKVIFDYARTFLETMQDRPFFSFAFAARLTHDMLNYAAYADDPAVEILNFLHETTITNSSLVVFMSDHGLRFGPIRETYIGKFEERWPIMFLSFPEWFLNRHPDIERNLRINQNRLTTPFDVHATFLDVFSLASGAPLPWNLNETGMDDETWSSRGISLFREVPTERTCTQASIQPHWCTCQTLVPVSTDKKEVRQAAAALLDALNEILLNYSSECARLSLDILRDAHLGQPSDEVLRFQRNVHDVIDVRVEYGPRVTAPTDYLVTVSVSPSGAVFEGTVRYDPTMDKHQVLGEVSRINRYGRQGDCVRNAELRKYCYCKKQVLDGVT